MKIVSYKFDYYDYVCGGIHPTFLHSLNFYSIICKVIRIILWTYWSMIKKESMFNI